MSNVIKISLPQSNPHAPAVNVYLLPKQKFLIDAGPANTKSLILLKKVLSNYDLTLTNLNGIILTHHHTDHIGLLKMLPHSIPLFCDKAIKYYGSKQYLNDIRNNVNNMQLSNTIKKELIEHLSSRYCPYINNYKIYPISDIPFIVNSMCGHSSSDSVIRILDMLFTGDLILKGIYFNNLLDINPKTKKIQKKQAFDFLESLSKIKKMNNINKICPGHGTTLEFQKGVQIINKNIKALKKHHAQLLTLPSTLSYSEIKAIMFPKALKVPDYFYLSELYSFIKQKH